VPLPTNAKLKERKADAHQGGNPMLKNFRL
jgi:hypothetical protein